MTQDKKEFTARSSETNPKRKAALLFKKRMRLLLRSGLVKGIIPLSMRKRSDQLTLDTVLKEPGGDSAERPRRGN